MRSSASGADAHKKTSVFSDIFPPLPLPLTILAILLIGEGLGLPARTVAFDLSSTVLSPRASRRTGSIFRSPLISNGFPLPQSEIPRATRVTEDGTSEASAPSAGELEEGEGRWVDPLHWEIGPTLLRPDASPLTPELRRALRTGTNLLEEQEELGRGEFTTFDWRKAWHTYAAPPDEEEGLIDPETGYADYEITDVEGSIPDDLSGVLYRNGSGKFGAGDERVQHVLDADGLVIRIEIPPPDDKNGGQRTPTFR